jgi:uncharacterized membrane protein
MTEDKVVAEIQQYGGKVLKSNLCHENEAKLQAALSSVQTPAASAVPKPAMSTAQKPAATVS